MIICLDEIPAPRSRATRLSALPDTALLVMGGESGSHPVSEWEARQLEASRRRA